VEALDRYLKGQAGQDARKHIAVVFIATFDDRSIAGYYTLSQYAVERTDLPDETAAEAAQVPRCSRNAERTAGREHRQSGDGLGGLLLADALRRCLAGSKLLASAAVIVDAKDVPAKAFYKKYGFVEFPGVASRLFLPCRRWSSCFADIPPGASYERSRSG